MKTFFQIPDENNHVIEKPLMLHSAATTKTDTTISSHFSKQPVIQR